MSNAHVGNDFEAATREYFSQLGIPLQRNYQVSVGLSSKKPRRFDLGSGDPPVLVECKSHTWTGGGNVPSAKLTSWNELDFVQLVDGVGDIAELNVDSDGDFLFSGSCPRHWKSPGVEQQPRMRELGYKSKLCTKQHYVRVRAVQGRLTDEAGTYV